MHEEKKENLSKLWLIAKQIKRQNESKAWQRWQNKIMQQHENI